MKDTELISLLRDFNQNSKLPSSMCGQFAIDFQKVLKDKKIKSRYIGVYCEPLLIEPDNRLVLDDLINNTGYVDSIVFDKRYSKVRWTHVLLEVNRGNEKAVIDPSNGILYLHNKTALLRGTGVEETVNESLEFLKGSVHIDKNYFYYLTKKFWLSIYYINYDNGHGKDMIQFGKYNFHPENEIW
jgi:hypothetical protein